MKEKVMNKSKYKEPLVHGTAMFPLSFHEITILPESMGNKRIYKTNGIIHQGHALPKEPPLYFHWHNEIEFFFLVEGRTQIQIGEKQVELKEKDVLFLQPDVLHGILESSKESLIFRSILFRHEFINSMEHDVIKQTFMIPLFSEQTLPFLLIPRDEKGIKVSRILDEIYELCVEKYIGYELLVKARILECIYEIYPIFLQYSQNKNINEDIGQTVKKLIQYVRDYSKYSLTLEEAANHVSMSKGYFCRFFKKNFHVTFVEYLSGIRLREAEKLIRTTEWTMSEIARETGFSSSNYLSVCFKKSFKMTPMEYRKKCKNEYLKL